MKKILDNKGLTLVEVIMTLAILGVVIGPLMNMLVLAGKITGQGDLEYKAVQTAQYYMEEIKAGHEIDPEVYVYNPQNMAYERIVEWPDSYSVEIRIRAASYGLHYIEIDILRDGNLINSLVGSVVFE